MNGLRVYFNLAGAEMVKGPRVFYSRRADGPYYRWRSEDEGGQWRCARVLPSDMSLKTLCVKSWKDVPATLQARLKEHYLE